MAFEPIWYTRYVLCKYTLLRYRKCRAGFTKPAFLISGPLCVIIIRTSTAFVVRYRTQRFGIIRIVRVVTEGNSGVCLS